MFTLAIGLGACTSANPGSSGQPGPRGPSGLPGPAGASGAAGTAGLCDSQSCPATTSVNGLSGGTISGTTTLDSVVVSSSLSVALPSTAAHGIIVTAGTRQTSLFGFYCGQTAFTTNGAMVNANDYNSDLTYMRQAKAYCETVCRQAAAHPCVTTEIQQWRFLGGGDPNNSPSAPNPAVPMPPDGTVGWVLSADSSFSCSDLQPNGSNYGTIYALTGADGVLQQEPCATTYPVLCCY